MMALTWNGWQLSLTTSNVITVVLGRRDRHHDLTANDVE